MIGFLQRIARALCFVTLATWINYTVAAPYEVGNSTIFIHDNSRPIDSVAGITKGVRTLITEIWYPVEHSSVTTTMTKSTYGDYVFGNKDVHHLMMTKTSFFHLTPDTVREGVTNNQINSAIEELFTRERNSYPDAPIATKGSPFPLVLLSHGDAGSRYNMESLAEYLASHGYIIIAPEHTGNSPYSMLGSDPALTDKASDTLKEIIPLLNNHGLYAYEKPDGQTYKPTAREASFSTVQQLDETLLERVNDVRASIDEATKINKNGSFAGKVDLNNIAIAGRSFGGLTSFLALDLEPRIKAGFAVVPAPLPNIKLNKLFRFFFTWGNESALFGLERDNGTQRLYKPTAIFVAEEDTLIINILKEFAKTFGDTAPTPRNRFPSLAQTYQDSHVPAIWFTLMNSNHESLAVAGSYWWPELKPNRFPRNFSPYEEYPLIDSQLAHDIQNSKALAFFDIYLKGNMDQLEHLHKEEPFYLKVESKMKNPKNPN